jgi:CubicO group peptidase (beta-lactamase class C family)
MRPASIAARRVVRFGVVAALLGGLGSGAAAQGLTPAELDAYVTRAVRDWRVTGLAIAVVKDDSVIFAKGYGVRELGKPGAVDAGTRFAIGSTTKAMTAVALGMLVDEGKVRWDEPVISYLPGFRVGDPYVTRELTVRDLLTHRGGLGNADQLWSAADYTPEEISRRVATLQPAYSLRSGFIYQNIMYAIAGDVVAAASGMPWATFLRTRIFTPLGMTATEPTLAALAGQPNVATPHADIRDTIRPISNRSVDAVGPAGSVWSSVNDMAKWMRFMLDSGRVGGKRLLTQATWREIMTPQVIAPPSMYTATQLTRPDFFTYGLGWFLHDYEGEKVAMHTGSIDGMSAIIGLLPERRVGVYVLANLDHAELRHALMYRVFDLARGRPGRDWSAELLALHTRLDAQADSARRLQQQRRAADTRPSLPLDRYAGTYSSPTYGDAVVSLRDGALHFAFSKGRRGRLTHWQYDTFEAQWEDIRMTPSQVVFALDGAGGVASVRAFGITFPRARARP